MEIVLVCFVGGIAAVVIFLSLWTRHKNRKLLLTVTDLHRGTSSEQRLLLKLLKHGIPSATIFHDLYVEKLDGNYSQVDVVIATSVGIIVIETKDFCGWIFGNGYQRNWTQVLSYGKVKNRFYNPVMQNSTHIDTLKKRRKPRRSVLLLDCI